MTLDKINSFFELIAFLFILLNCYRLIKDGQLKGISKVSCSFFFVWSFFNLYYYSGINQFYSFISSLLVFISNFVYIVLIFTIPSMKKQKIVCLCGSTKFKESFINAQRNETLKGNIVLSVGLFGHIEGLDMKGETKKMLDELHKRKIDLSDEILVINIGGYIGESTRSEIEYAIKNKKRIKYLE